MRAIYCNHKRNSLNESVTEGVLCFSPNEKLDSPPKKWGKPSAFMWIKTPPLIESFYPSTPISLPSFALYFIEKNLRRLWHRLGKNSLYARKVEVKLFCQYYDSFHSIEVTVPNVEDYIEQTLSAIEMALIEIDDSNPIKKVSLEITPAVRKPKSRKCNYRIGKGYLGSDDRPALLARKWLKRDHKDSGQFRSLPLGELSSLKLLGTYSAKDHSGSDWQESRGREFFAAMTESGQKKLIMYDRIENDYFIEETSA